MIANCGLHKLFTCAYSHTGFFKMMSREKYQHRIRYLLHSYLMLPQTSSLFVISKFISGILANCEPSVELLEHSCTGSRK